MSHVATPARSMSLAQGIDLFERMFALGLFVFLYRRMADSIWARGDYIYGAIILVEFFVLGFILFRPLASNVSTSPRDWLVAGLGTCLPMLVVPATHPPIAPVMVSAFAIVLGFILQFHGKLTLNRSFGIVAANRGVKTKGPYVLVRHPIYLGYTLTHAGFLLYAPHWWNFAVYGLGLVFQILRILAEERVLARDAAYRDYAAAVPYRLVPGLF